ncbi:MAG TPA: ribosome maturation factor RimM [Beijerinckiaceae bacterium]|nr:ribosome maturation factor RimM [Beijerinckiaceae bacterium]
MGEGRTSKRRSLPSPLAGEGREGVRGRRAQPAVDLAPTLRTLRSGGGPSTPSPARPREGKGKSTLVLIGEFGRAHGLRGEVRLKSYTAEPAAIASYAPLLAEDGRAFTLESVRPAGGSSPDMLIARVKGIATREAAEALNRVRLHAPRDRLSPPEAEDEFLAADLIGLAAESTAGAQLGTIVAVPNYGGGDLLEIAPPRGPSALLPFTKAFVPTVDLAGGRVVVDPPADLFDSVRDERA